MTLYLVRGSGMEGRQQAGLPRVMEGSSRVQVTQCARRARPVGL
jgi:hypothetical protein